jgi:excisionase family DNA binding protein
MTSRNSQATKKVKAGPEISPPKPSKPESPECRTVSLEDAAKILGISRASTYAYAKSGDLPVIRIGNRLLMPKAAIDKLFAEYAPA